MGFTGSSRTRPTTIKTPDKPISHKSRATPAGGLLSGKVALRLIQPDKPTPTRRTKKVHSTELLKSLSFSPDDLAASQNLPALRPLRITRGEGPGKLGYEVSAHEHMANLHNLKHTAGEW